VINAGASLWQPDYDSRVRSQSGLLSALTVKVRMRQPAADVERHPASNGGTNTLQQ
jgi:hypothetical protein